MAHSLAQPPTKSPKIISTIKKNTKFKYLV